MRGTMFGAALLTGLSGCSTMFSGAMFGKTDPIQGPQTSGEAESGYTYIPVDPFPVETVYPEKCTERPPASRLLESLPDNAVRMLVEQFDVGGKVTYGVSKSGVRGESYRVTVDYINADTINMPIWITKQMRSADPKDSDRPYFQVPVTERLSAAYVPGTEYYTVTTEESKKNFLIENQLRSGEKFNLPVYVGVGLRVQANVYVVKADAEISGIGIIGAEAEANRLRGSLVVQTLGVNGKSIAAALPIQSELNRTTAQNAIVAVSAIKALLYSDETMKSPRVVGIYLPIPGGKPLVNAIISELSKAAPEWKRPCPVEVDRARIQPAPGSRE